MGKLTSKGYRGQGKTMDASAHNKQARTDANNDTANREASGIEPTASENNSGTSEGLSRFLVAGRRFRTAQEAMMFMATMS